MSVQPAVEAGNPGCCNAPRVRRRTHQQHGAERIDHVGACQRAEHVRALRARLRAYACRLTGAGTSRPQSSNSEGARGIRTGPDASRTSERRAYDDCTYGALYSIQQKSSSRASGAVDAAVLSVLLSELVVDPVESVLDDEEEDGPPLFPGK